MTRPTVTILIDTYNHERFIAQAITSVLEQDFPQSEMEILVVDDGSKDRTSDIIGKFAPRVRHIRKANGGQASAFNAGIPQARGQIVAFLDGDDWWATNKLSRTVGVLDRFPEVGVVGHGNIMVYPDGRHFQETLREGHRFRANTPEGALLFRTRKNCLGTRMVLRAEILRGIGKVPEEFWLEADEYLFTLAAVLTNVEVLPDPLLYYRQHDSNLFMTNGQDPARMRRKQVVLNALAHKLRIKLASLGLDPKVCRMITEVIQAEADQLRLAMGEGWPWETVRTERTIYNVLHPDSPFSHRVFKWLVLLGAFVTPPKVFYSVRGKLARNDTYRRIRQRWLPNPEIPHLRREWRMPSQEAHQ